MTLPRVAAAAISVLAFLTSCRGGSNHAIPPVDGAAARHALSTSDAYASAVLADAPTAYYRLDDAAGGTVADSSGNALNGSAGSAVSTGAAGLLPASIDAAMTFPGTATAAGIVKTAQSALLQPTAAVSFEGWLKFAATPPTYTVAFAYGSDSSYAPYDFYFNNGKLVAQFALNTGTLTVTSPTALQPNTAYYAAATYDGTTATLYINGSAVASAVKTGTITGYLNGYGLAIGDDAALSDPAFNGTIDEVAVYAGKALSSTQIANHYYAGTHLATPTPNPTATPTPVATPTPAPINISVVQTCGSASVSNVAAITVSCAPPVPGDALIAIVYVYNYSGINNGITTPAGWTNYDSTFVTRNEIATYSRIAGAGDTTTKTWTFTLAAGSDYMDAVIYELSGVNTTSPIDGHGTASYAAAQTSESTPLLTPSFANDFAIATFGSAYRAPATPPASWAPYQVHKGTYENTYSTPITGTAGVQATAAWTTGPTSGQANLLLIAPLASPTPVPTPSVAPAYTDWNTFGDGLSRTQFNASETTLTPGTVPNLKLIWKVNLGGAITAQPVIATGVTINGTPRNVAYVGTETGTFYALDATTGATIWTASLASVSSGCMDLPGGRFGITGTATYDRSLNRIYVADGHDQVHALDMSTGLEQTSAPWPVTVTSQFAANHIYSALALNPANGMLYVTTGSYCDLNSWQGRVAAINTTQATVASTFYPATPYNGDGIWGMGGPAIDANNDVYVATGNTSGGSNDASAYGDALVHLTSSLGFVASNSPGPVSFDNDFGASPMTYQPPSCPPLVTAKRKDGGVNTWQTSNVAGGPLQSLLVAYGSDTGQFVGAGAYSPATNLVYVGVPAGTTTNGVTYTNGLLALAPQADCTLAMAWQQNAGKPAPRQVDDNYAVTVGGGVVYLTDGIGDHVFAFDASSGAPLWNSGNLIGGATMASPTVDGRLYVSAWDGYLYSFGL